jgi:protein-tyrosine phosphatase
MTLTTTTTREISLSIAHNVRHLGGYPTSYGRTTARNVVRAASLHRLTSEGLGALSDNGVRTIVDFRSQVERERDVTPDVAPFGLQRVDAPVFEQDASPVGLDVEFPGFASVYVSMMESGRTAYRTLFETIATTDGAVLFHCAAGKDRTGVAAALLLSLAGVDDDTIVEDYALSETLLRPLLGEWLPRMAERGISEDRARALMAASPGDMVATLAHIRARFGSSEGYMAEIGVSPQDITAVRSRLLD